MTISVRYPRALATTASPIPVMPAVASTTRPPGLSSPRLTASRTIHFPARSLTDWPGFMNSALPRMVQPVSSEARFNLISGVLPIASTTSLLIFMPEDFLLVRLSELDQQFNEFGVDRFKSEPPQ